MGAKGSWRRKLGAIAAGLLTASAVSIAVVAFDAWRYREYTGSCSTSNLDATALGIDSAHLEGVTESWEWWPTGLSCHFPLVDGGYLTVGPGPLLSIVFVLFLLGAVGGLAALVVRSIAFPRATGRPSN